MIPPEIEDLGETLWVEETLGIEEAESTQLPWIVSFLFSAHGTPLVNRERRPALQRCLLAFMLGINIYVLIISIWQSCSGYGWFSGICMRVSRRPDELRKQEIKYGC